MGEMTNYRAMAKTLDVAAATAYLGPRIPKGVLKNDRGVTVDTAAWVLSGLHHVRASDPAAAPADVAASKLWLSQNGWDFFG